MKEDKEMKTHLYRVALAVFLLALLTTGLASAQEGDNVVVQVSWVHAPTWTGFYAAQDEGFYTESGFDVELRTIFDDAGERRDVIAEVVSGNAQFGSVSAQELLEARAAGQPVVAIAAIYQLNPAGFSSLAEQNIRIPQDLVGKTVSTSESSRYLLEAMLEAAGVDPAEVNIVPRTDFTLNPLLNGEIDVLSTFVMNSEASLSIQGVDFNTIYPFEYGVEMYSNLIITSEDMIQNDPGMVQSFLAATLQGIQSAVDDPERAGENIAARDEELDRDELIEGMFRSVPLLNPAGSQPGMMQPEIWQIGYEILVDQGLLSDDLDVSSAYTLQFLDAIYGN
jgi:NitT/TauT family transport system substrate-binding protein